MGLNTDPNISAEDEIHGLAATPATAALVAKRRRPRKAHKYAVSVQVKVRCRDCAKAHKPAVAAMNGEAEKNVCTGCIHGYFGADAKTDNLTPAQVQKLLALLQSKGAAGKATLAEVQAIVPDVSQKQVDEFNSSKPEERAMLAMFLQSITQVVDKAKADLSLSAAPTIDAPVVATVKAPAGAPRAVKSVSVSGGKLKNEKWASLGGKLYHYYTQPMGRPHPEDAKPDAKYDLPVQAVWTKAGVDAWTVDVLTEDTPGKWTLVKTETVAGKKVPPVIKFGGPAGLKQHVYGTRGGAAAGALAGAAVAGPLGLAIGAMIGWAVGPKVAKQTIKEANNTSV